MGVLDDLIKIKTAKQEDDLLKLLDEIIIYDKLSANPELADLKKSEITRKKCPLLAGYKDGKLYETLLADLAANVYLQIENQIPDILLGTLELSTRQEKQKEVLKKGITHINYRTITEYDHEEMGSLVVAVFTKKENTSNTVAIITKTSDGYVMYHGSYIKDITDAVAALKSEPIIVSGESGIFAMESYSVLGNNGYRFGTYTGKNGKYDVMLGTDYELYLMDKGQAFVYQLPPNKKNKIYMSKRDAQLFAEAVTEAIESVV